MSSRIISAPALLVAITMVFLKSIFLPIPSVRYPSSKTCKNKFRIFGWAFSISSSKTEEKGFSRTGTVKSPTLSSEPINLGSGIEISIRRLVWTIIDVINCTGIVNYTGSICWNTSFPDGQPYRTLDTSKAEKLFGFKSATSLRDGLSKTIDWYINNRSVIEEDNL